MTRQPSERARFEVLLEEVRSQFQVLAEGHSGLRQTNESIDKKIDRTREALELRIGFVESAVLTGFRDVRQRLVQIEQRIDVHEQTHSSKGK